MEEKTRRAEKTKVTRGQVVLAVIILLFTILCFLPVALVLVVSFSSDVSIAERGFTFFPSADSSYSPIRSRSSKPSSARF